MTTQVDTQEIGKEVQQKSVVFVRGYVTYPELPSIWLSNEKGEVVVTACYSQPPSFQELLSI